MSKHEAEIHTLGHIMSLMDQSVGYWTDTLGIEIDGVVEASDAGDDDKVMQLEHDYIRAHKNDKYRVTWPDHVTVKKFNTDATYQLV
jgi:hypothetical protein